MKLIAKRYIIHGRFFFDLISCMPIELIAGLSGSKIPKG
jgi:hypothetical protein